MVSPIRVLLITNTEQDAWFVADMLRSHGTTLTCERVDTLAAIEEALSSHEWDLVISDYAMGQFTALSVLALVRRKGLDLPFIIFSEAIGEELAVEAIKAGAHEYVTKGNPARLLSAIESELQAGEIRGERNRVKAVLQQKEEYFQSLIENSSDIITVIDSKGMILYDSPSVDPILGYRQGELVGESIFNYVHPDDLPRVTEIVKKGVEEIGKSHVVEFRFRRRDGMWRLLESVGRGYKTSSGSIVGIINSRDVTARRQTEERLKQVISQLTEREQELLRALGDLKQSHEALYSTQAQLLQSAKLESVGRLAAGVAHEVKNPLATIYMGTQYLSKRLTTTDEKIHEVLQDIETAIQRADSIIVGILDFSSSQSISFTSQDLNALVEHALMLLKYELDNHHITVVKSLDSPLPPLKLDKQKMEQALINLLLNAIQAMSGGGSLSVTTRVAPMEEANFLKSSLSPGQAATEEHIVLVEIDDTGPGIPEAYLPRIFDPFFTGRPDKKGSGLGLTITRNIIELHGGMIHVQNRKSGGVRVTIALRM